MFGRCCILFSFCATLSGVLPLFGQNRPVEDAKKDIEKMMQRPVQALKQISTDTTILKNETDELHKLSPSKPVRDKFQNTEERLKASSEKFQNEVKYKQTIPTSKTDLTNRFKHLKIDTGSFDLNKKELSNRGKHFLNGNGFSTDIPKPPHKQFDANLKTISPGEPVPLSKDFNLRSLNQVSSEKLNNVLTTDKEKIKTSIPSVSEFQNRKLSNELANLAGTKKIYSAKLLKKAYDSLGLHKADSIFQVAAPLADKPVSKDEMIQAINKSLGDTRPKDLNYNDKNGLVSNKQLDQANALPNQFHNGDLTKMTLPPEVLSDLRPIGVSTINGKYMHVVDSMRKINLKRDGLILKENRVTDKIKTTAVERKANFWDKSYLDGVLGILQNNKFTIIQFAPALGYHFTENFSVGAGPSILVTAEEKKLNAAIGLRYFTKMEILEKKAYLQLEDDMSPFQASVESVRLSTHSILMGMGVILPLGHSFALNPCILYRVNNSTTLNNTGSPWVFRLGISSIKTKN